MKPATVTLTGFLALAFLAAPAFTQASHEAALKNLKFRSIGPAIMGGRVDDFAVVESDPRIIYVGTAAGGIFKTVNSGVTWEPIFDDQPNSPSATWRWLPTTRPSCGPAPASLITARARHGAPESSSPWTAATPGSTWV